MKLIFFLLFSFSLFAAELQKDSFDVNDVSLLFAKNQAHAKPYPEIQATAGDLIPETVFADLLAFLQSAALPPGSGQLVLHSAARKREGWFVQSLRVDDCAPKDGAHEPLPSLPHITKCEPQLRLVLQPIEKATEENQGHLNLGQLSNTKGDEAFDGFFQLGDLVTSDNALHLIFAITEKAEWEALLTELQEIKLTSPTRTAGRPLGVHPGLLTELKAQGAAPLARRVTALIAKFALAKHLKRITFFGPTNRVWVFIGGKVFRDNEKKWRWEATDQANVGGSKAQTGSINFSSSSKPAPTPINPPKISRDLIRKDGPVGGETAEEAKARRLGALASMLNPYRIHSENVDCLSCHLAGLDFSIGSEMMRKEKALELLNQKGFWEIPSGVTPFVSFAKEVANGYTQVSNWNMRAFGYYFGHPVASFRTLMESLRVASSLNKTYQLQSRLKPCFSKERYANALEKFGDIHTYAEEAKIIESCTTER